MSARRGPERERGDPRVQRRTNARGGARGARGRLRAARRGHRRRRPLDGRHGRRSRARTARAWWRGPSVGYAGGARNRGWDAATATSSSSSTPTPSRCPASAPACAAPRASFPERSSAVRAASRRTRPGRGSRTCRSRRRTSSAAGRATCSFVSSYCMLVPRALDLRFDESYGGEDAVFSADALDRGIRLVFDPRYAALHDHDRDTFAKLRRQQARVAFAAARIGPVQREGVQQAHREPRAAALLRAAAPAGHLPAPGRAPAAAPALRAPAAADGGGGVDARRLRRALRGAPAAAACATRATPASARSPSARPVLDMRGGTLYPLYLAN